MIRRKAVWCLISFAALRMGVAVGQASDIPKTWTSVQWGGDMNAKAADTVGKVYTRQQLRSYRQNCRESLAAGSAGVP